MTPLREFITELSTLEPSATWHFTQRGELAVFLGCAPVDAIVASTGNLLTMSYSSASHNGTMELEHTPTFNAAAVLAHQLLALA